MPYITTQALRRDGEGGCFPNLVVLKLETNILRIRAKCFEVNGGNIRRFKGAALQIRHCKTKTRVDLRNVLSTRHSRAHGSTNLRLCEVSPMVWYESLIRK
jgi:hypothetical protein